MENVAERLHTQPKEVLERLRFIACVAQELGYPAYVVGGFVRDLLLEVPDYDLDIVVEGDGIHFAKELSSRLNVGFVKHKQFGTATLITHDKVKVDVATARQETYEYPGSLPKVRPGAIKDDLARRDFSINAMAVDISQSNFGRLVDFFEGRQDLKKKIIRVLHKESFIDDPTRIFRAVRFQQRFGFHLEPLTLKLLQQAVKKQMLENVHTHRLRDELLLILKEPQAVKCIERLNALSALACMNRKLSLNNKTFRLFREVEGMYLWFKEKFPHKHKVEIWLLYLALLLENLKSDTLSRLLKDFAFRKYEAEAVFCFKEEAQRLLEHLEGAHTPSEIYKVLSPLKYEVVLLLLLKTRDEKIKNKIRDFLLMYKGIQIHLNGEELKTFGMSPGPHFKNILKMLLYAKLDKKFTSKEDEVLYLKHKILTQGYVKTGS